jgi:hypothetical protein
MHSDSPSFTNDAMDVIRNADPAMYAKMNASPWTVHMIRTGREDSVTDIAIDYGAPLAQALVDRLNGAYGVTSPGGEGMPQHVTFLNVHAIEYEARRLRVPCADFLADVLVHEFTHDDGGQGEPEAYAAGTAFARKLPASDAPIAKLSEDILKDWQDGDL